MSAGARHTGWQATPLLVATTVTAVVLTVAAVLGHRGDLLVLAAPLVAVVTWARVARPTSATTIRMDLSPAVVEERGSALLRVELEHDPAAEVAGVDLAPGPRVLTDPPGGALHRALDGGTATTVPVSVVPAVWGPHRLGRGEVRLSSAWGGYVSRVSRTTEVELTALPAPRRLRSRADALIPAHLIGRHVSRRQGDGLELAEIRPFRPGDRIRRIHWPSSVRTRELHVRTTCAEQDGQVVLLVDAMGDIPHRDPREPGSIETSVQAAAHVAAHFVEAGDRVSLRILGDGSLPVPAGTGRRHLQRLLRALALVDVAGDRTPDVQRLHLGMQPGALLLAITPLTSRVVVDAVAATSRSHVRVAVIDTAPAESVAHEPADRIAWRLACLERERTRDLLTASGTPVVAWQDGTGVELLLGELQTRRQAVGR